jgi:hypothetical protein
MMSAATGMLTVIKATLRTLSRPLRPLSEVQVGVDQSRHEAGADDVGGDQDGSP